MSFRKMTVRDVPLERKTVLLRADYNVPLEKDGSIADDYRITQSLPTIDYLLENNCRIIITSHLGRPDGKRNANYTLERVAQHLANLLHRPVRFVPDCVGDRVKQVVRTMKPGDIALLENVRFHPQEEANDESFARRLAADTKADYLIQDCFGVAHRAHASIVAITHFLPSVAGLLLEKEVATLEKVADDPDRPFSVVLGGAKVSDKIKVVEKFVQSADKVIIGGAMANNFLLWEGYSLGNSKLEPEAKETVERIMAMVCGDMHDHRVCARDNRKIVLPIDAAVGTSVSAEAERVTKRLEDIAPNDYILDMGDASIERMIDALEGSKTILWNGTLGMAELDNFAHGSARLSLWMATHKAKMRTVIGGGDTADFVLHWDAAHGKSFTHVSTGGGASLELLAGDVLPGVEALIDSRHPRRKKH